MTPNVIDQEIDKLSEAEIDSLLASSYADRRCKIEVFLTGTALFLGVCLCIAHVSLYIGEFHPPKLHRAFLLFMAALVVPYATAKFYKDAYSSIVVRATRRIFLRASRRGP